MNSDSDPVPQRAEPPRDHCEISLQNPCRYPEVRTRRLRAWLVPLVDELAPEAGSLAVCFVSDREIRRLNAGFRGRDEPTDVLSFPGELGAPSGPGFELPEGADHLGDVAISVPAARRQARHLDHSVERELRLLLLHGVLHCLGHDHETDGGTMARLESRLRRRYIDHG